MPFLSLPREIHQQIISYLPSNHDVAALSIQCRTLHTMCDMAARHKYHRIIVSSDEEKLDRAFDLLMDILKCPTLGQYVRCIECWEGTSTNPVYKEIKYQRDLSTEEMDLVRKAVRKGGFTGPREEPIVNMLMQRIEKAGVDQYGQRDCLGTFVSQALTAILIVVSPNLVSMAITPPCGSPSTLAELLTGTNADPKNKPYLRLLRDVYLINESKDSWNKDRRFLIEMDFFGCLRLLDNLPSIKTVRTDNVDVDRNTELDFNERYSNISRISIQHSSFDSTSLAALLVSCKVLREFQYSVGGRGSRDGGIHMFNPKAFFKAACLHKDTLELLDLDVESQIDLFDISDEEERVYAINEYGSPYESGIDDGPRTFLQELWSRGGSLRDFVTLKSLSLGINLLLYFAKGLDPQPEQKKDSRLVDCLPKSLEHLCVRGYHKGDNPEHDKYMDELLTLSKVGPSQLKEIEGIEQTIPNAGYRYIRPGWGSALDVAFAGAWG
ncbi:hypothetical protein N7535_006320 [Penicillium sp. DV-2018c]|nr:hypothetical protein N7461_007601 [Penicillium sp. DV-2018c]KAJ5567014.1 hypothetical protein N7535_006320 [Penicillium sp. DV-2018c]